MVCVIDELGAGCGGIRQDISLQFESNRIDLKLTKLLACHFVTCVFIDSEIYCRFPGTCTMYTLLSYKKNDTGLFHSCANKNAYGKQLDY